MLVKALETLELLENSGNGRNVKIEILRKNANNCVLKGMFLLCYDWMRTYGITVKVPKMHNIPAKMELTDENSQWPEFVTLLGKYERREITGNEAKFCWDNLLQYCDDLESKWYTRILNRDMRVGINFGTIDKVWPGLLSQFKCQTAKVWDAAEGLNLTRRNPLYNAPVWVEKKIDGLRSITVIKNGKGFCYSRNGKLVESLQFIADALAQIDDNVVIDGKIYSDNWNETSSVVKTLAENMTKEKQDKLDKIKYMTFDRVPFDEFVKGGSNERLRVRYEKLRNVVNEANKRFPNIGIELVQHDEVSDVEGIYAAYDRYLEMGYEGAMLKYPESLYECGRSWSWMKIKPDTDEDLEIIGVLEGTGKYVGMLGALVVELPNGGEGKIGSGFTDQDRKYLWNNQKEIIGKYAEFKVQKDNTSVATIRFPRFLRICDDK